MLNAYDICCDILYWLVQPFSFHSIHVESMYVTVVCLHDTKELSVVTWIREIEL